MSEFESVALVIVVMVAAVAAALLGIPWMVRSERDQRKRSPTSGMIGIADELFHPGAHQADLIWVAQTEMPAPAPLAGDPFPEGKVRLRVEASERAQGHVEARAKVVTQAEGDARGG